MNRRLAILPVTAQLLRDALHLPDSVRIDSVSFDHNLGLVLLRLEGPDFPEIPLGVLIQRIDATYRTLEDGTAEFVGWTK